MKHDHEWFANVLGGFAKGDGQLKHDVCQIAMQYHEHMTKGAEEFDAEIYKSQEDAKIQLEDRIAELEAAFSITHNHLTELQIAIVAKAHGLDPDDRRRFITNANLAAIAKTDADLL